VSRKLDDRLIAVAKQIRSNVHADIGSDHGSLLVALFESGRIESGIAIENKQMPFENSARALRGLSADVRLGDGLEVLKADEADSLSICGLGSESIRDILLAHPDRIPERVVLQVFHKSQIIRRWGLDNGFHLLDEQVTRRRRPYTILSFCRAANPDDADPAYEGIDRESATLFGPFVLKREDRQFDLHLQHQEAWWRKFDRLSSESASRLGLLRQVMADRRIEPLPNSVN
jgi:tRNA (adenine22-N1)-methyltransferase